MTTSRFPVSRLLPPTIRGRLILLVLVVLVPLMFAEGAFNYRHYVDTRAHEFQVNLELARLIGTNFDGYIRNILADEEAIGNKIVATRATVEQIGDLLSVPARAYTSVAHVDWINPQGVIVSSSNRSVLGQVFRDKGSFDQIVSGKEWLVTDLLPGEDGGKTTFAVARGIRDERNDLVGVASMVIDADGLNDILSVERAGQGAIALIDGQGRRVYRYPSSPVGTSDRDWIKTQPIIRDALGGREAVGTITAINGAKRMASYVPIPSIGWVATASRVEDEAMGPIIADIFREMALFSLIALVALLGSVIVGRGISRPIRRLRQHALALEDGELDTRVELAGPAELMTLASVFNKMTEALRNREEKLQAQNEELHCQQEELQAQNEELQSQAAILRAVEERERGIIDNSTAVIYLKDIQGRYILVNRQYEALFHVTNTVIAGKTDFDLFPKDQAEAFRDHDREVLKAGRPIEFEEVFPQDDGSHTYISIKYPLRDHEGAIYGICGISTDITDRKRIEQLREEYVHTISHDLRNPLTLIQGHAQLAEMICRDKPDARMQRSAKAIISAATEMNAMIQDLLDAARIESGQMKVEPRQIDLGKRVVDLLERMNTVAGVDRVLVEIPEDLPAVFADPVRIDRVLTNLITNALKYGGLSGEIRIKGTPSDQAVEMAVIDCGPGIAEEELANIFDRFYRSRTTRDRKDGLGLGLYITKGLVEAQGGRVWAESKVGVGTSMFFTLPTVQRVGLEDSGVSQ